MDVELPFPLEFVVEGTAVSFQAKRPATLQEWKARIIASSRPILPEGHFASRSPVAVTLFYFPAVPMSGDIDNIVKPVLDALCRHIYMDDHQVHRVLAQKFEPGNVFGFSSPSGALAEALGKPKPILYVRVSADPFEDLV